MSKKNVKRIIASIIIIATGLYIYTCTDYYARKEINKNLDANGIDVTMNTEEILALDLGKYEKELEKEFVRYLFYEGQTEVEILEKNDKIWRIELGKNGQSVYGIVIGQTTFEEATSILKNIDFFNTDGDGGNVFVKKYIEIGIGYGGNVSRIDIRFTPSLPKLYYIVFDLLQGK